jgi:hypothetical protein
MLSVCHHQQRLRQCLIAFLFKCRMQTLVAQSTRVLCWSLWTEVATCCLRWTLVHLTRYLLGSWHRLVLHEVHMPSLVISRG